ncbi:SMI1/KNR4 family protein [Spongiactinospora rosea]|uniref:SMI1/KNR4 family protein n=1 Tax=Spongiactinospora rosea TaxID=2248750 RepID=UPI0011C07496|nr:SMI1/KNR4 family protein [Spongiactinospora rosea]
MKSSLDRLAALGSPPLGASLHRKDRVPEILRPLVALKNGFYAFESALHIFPWEGARGSMGARSDQDAWLHEYGDVAARLTFFAEDAFGFRFAIEEGKVASFDPETAERDTLASSIEDWATLILDDYETQTGFPIMHEWQLENGAIPEGHRLAPAIPFFLGGAFNAQAMRPKESLELMRFRADIYHQVKELPDGAQIRLRVGPQSS